MSSIVFFLPAQMPQEWRGFVFAARAKLHWVDLYEEGRVALARLLRFMVPTPSVFVLKQKRHRHTDLYTAPTLNSSERSEQVRKRFLRLGLSALFLGFGLRERKDLNYQDTFWQS